MALTVWCLERKNQNLKELKELVINMTTNKLDLDVIAICETWLTDNQLNLVDNLPSFQLYCKNRTNRGGGGVAIHVNMRHRSILNNIEIPTECAECIYKYVHLNGDQYITGEMYRLPNTPEKDWKDFLCAKHVLLSDVTTKKNKN